MAPKANTPKGKGGSKETGVLASLSPTRPARLSGRERSSAAAPARRSTAPTRAKPKATKAAASKAPATTPKPRATARRAAAKPVAAAEPVAAAKPVTTAEPVAAAKPVTTAEPARPRPVRAGSRALAEANEKSAGKRLPADPQPPSGTDLVSTVVQAAGELAQVGLTVGGQILKRAVEKLPKP